MYTATSSCLWMPITALVLTLAAMNAYSSTIVETDGSWIVSDNDGKYLEFDPPTIGPDIRPVVRTTDAGGGWHRVSLSWTLSATIAQDELAVEFNMPFEPDFHWMPHLAPDEGFVAAQHVFRSPALIAARGDRVLAIVPDLDLVGDRPDNPWFIDLDARKQKAWLGLSLTDIPVHVGFTKKPGMTFHPGPLELAFFVNSYRDTYQPLNPWKRVSRFLWDKWAHPLYERGEPGRVPMDTYVRHTYDWAFRRWQHAVWQEFELGGRRVGAPQFIVNVSQSPNYPGPWFQREFLSIWNQAWFSSLRSASGLARWARAKNDIDLRRKAELTKALALSAPMKDGLFPSVIRTDNVLVEIEGKRVHRPKPWSEAYWINSNRCPRNFNVTPEWYHVLDASWTCLLMLHWYREIEPDQQLLEYSTQYANRLVTLQDPQGFFPGWLHPETLKPAEIMNQTPETAMSVTFLLKLASITQDKRYKEAAIKAADALLAEIVPTGRWEDYETYWSCSAFGQNDHVGKKYARNNMYKQNTLSMFWTAEALLECYRVTQNRTYLDWGRRTLDELSMAQQVWQPPYIHVPALGGFGVMNFDGEWNDSRQSLFAELFMQYYKETGEPPLFERGVAALKSSFVMMYCPENPQQKEQWEKAHPFFGPQEYGFMMENYGHGGRTSPEGVGIGVFTIYDWGNGAASEARMRIRDHFGDVYIDRKRRNAFGIDSIATSWQGDTLTLSDPAGRRRTINVVYEDGSGGQIVLDGSLILEID